MTSKDLNQVSRELAEHVVPHPQTCTEQYCTCTGWLIENRFRVEAVIREAMQKALEHCAIELEQHPYWFELTKAPGFAKWLRGKAASSLTEQENKND